jgi:hypothetical protein
LTPEKQENATETLKVILPISTEKFFELFFADDAPYSMEELFRDVVSMK